MVSFKLVECDDEIDQVVGLANTIWHETYANLLSVEQRNYMLDTFQSKSAIKASSLKYYLIYKNDDLVGYVGLGVEDQALLLSKIYLLSEMRGQGILKEILELARSEAKDNGLLVLRLYVNKENRAIEAYRAHGFEIIESIIKDIGDGYVMDDYLMEVAA